MPDTLMSNLHTPEVLKPSQPPAPPGWRQVISGTIRMSDLSLEVDKSFQAFSCVEILYFLFILSAIHITGSNFGFSEHGGEKG